MSWILSKIILKCRFKITLFSNFDLNIIRIFYSGSESLKIKSKGIFKGFILNLTVPILYLIGLSLDGSLKRKFWKLVGWS